MSEGGNLLWKRQSIDNHRGPVGDYKSLQRPLPAPPEHLVWVRNEKTKEWRLEERAEDEFVATAEFIGESDMIVHDIQPTDTFEGICLRYKVSPTALRQANSGFQGTNLAMAPNPLVIPTNDHGTQHSQENLVVDTLDMPEQKLSQLQRSCRRLSKTEAKSYLELNEWDLNAAFQAAQEDGF
mmetsp:Transcript_61740/g.93209  ORF Transcript_61740/g.93209 Transcript_61740/m.93209 type:complete len:182 (+) Transcript_61740:138-683(+)|eukprot:CAMPEP_0117020844 /NCGR_PEP_ID=MMETSP0472-20121206/15798_1 /TAXON_ID=693140 ORGANISM="Tiarina fusus, Strain LIS" /NCGR_SAMPLE_ID=MMETSP0472 /ASSEMBLY_ACC=CAM_ASM_000603 /LENGTH=181 /DNA_ID=CAMNT_0004726167 /DNA_START=136 /DNA_END=681 /DNA_ORIENTATION=+